MVQELENTCKAWKASADEIINDKKQELTNKELEYKNLLDKAQKGVDMEARNKIYEKAKTLYIEIDEMKGQLEFVILQLWATI